MKSLKIALMSKIFKTYKMSTTQYKCHYMYLVCSDQHVKYHMPSGFPLTIRLLFDYRIKQYPPYVYFK